MISIIRERLRQGMRTIGYPESVPTLPDRFLGLPVLDQSKCTDGCRACAQACPTDAIATADGDLSLDMGLCLFCGDCVAPARRTARSTSARTTGSRAAAAKT